MHKAFHQSEIRDVEVHQVTDQIMRLLNALSAGDLGVKPLLSSLSLNHRPTFMQNYLQPALEAKFVEMTQPDSPRSPTQKYRLTKQGSAYLQQINKEKA